MRRISAILFAMLLSVLMIGMTFAQEWEPDAAKMLVEPAVVTANPGDTFWVAVNIEKITDLYGFEFKLGYESGTKVIGALTAEEGGFLWGPEGTAFTFSVDKIEGNIHVGGSILGDWPGVTGTGTLAMIQFVVGEGGDSPLELYDINLLDSNLDEMICQTRDGLFDGTNVELVRVNLGARSMHVGETATFEAKIVNEGTVPMYTRARFDSVRAEDGMTTTLWSNQSWQYPPVRDPEELHVDGFSNVVNFGWTQVGTSPWLDAAGDGSYITSTSNGAQMRFFSFEDIALEGAIVDYVQLSGYTDGPLNPGIDYDVYTPSFDWLGSLYATGAPAWVTPRWVGSDRTSDILPALITEEGINDLEVLVYFYDPDILADGTDVIDALRLEITYKADRVALPLSPDDYVIQPGEVLTLESAVWPLQPEDPGTYITTVTVYYSFGGTFWNIGAKKVVTRSWWVK